MDRKSQYRFVIILSFALLLIQPALYAGVKMGEEIRIRGIAIDNADYNDENRDHNNYYYQRARFLIEGVLEKRIYLNIRIQSRGILGSTKDKIVLEGVEKPNLTPFIENAYVRFVEIEDLPIDLTIGRQPITYGDGVVINDNELGFDGVVAKFFLPGNLDLTGITVKSLEASGETAGNEGDQDLYGAVLNTVYKRKGLELYFWQSNDRTLSDYKDNKSHLGIRLSGKLPQGIEYKAEIARQTGKKDFYDEGTSDIKYDGSAFLMGGIFRAAIPYIGQGRLYLEYLQGSGNDQDTDEKDEGFYSEYGHLMEEGFGEVYMMSRESSADNYSINNLKIFKVGIAASPRDRWTLGSNFFVYTFNWTPENRSDDVGTEFDVYTTFDYTSNSSFRIVYGRFTPGDGIVQGSDDVEKLLGEVIVRF